MPLEGSFAIWNNRGGTGKTTLTYHLANKYATKHPDKTVLLIDMCPQADLSHAFLGDDENHMDYVSQLGTLKKDCMVIGEHKIPKTVSGYLDLCTSVGLPSNVDPRTFLINVSKFNSQLSRNLYLLCGDASIELVARSLEIKRNQHSTLSQFGQYAWKSVTCCLKQFIKKIAERKGIKLVVFIDVNSSFSIITEIALAASDKLIIPITDDHLHRNGFEYMFALLYGFSQPSNVYYYYRHFSFYYRANQHDVKLPKIHLILNKVSKQSPSLTSSDNLNTTINNNNKNNTSNSSENNESEWEFIFDLYKKHPQAFTLRMASSTEQTLKDFKQEYVIDLYEHASSNQIVKQAVRCHSPLLNVKNSLTTNNSTNNLYLSCNNIAFNSSSSSNCISTTASRLNRPSTPTVSHSPIENIISKQNSSLNVGTETNLNVRNDSVNSKSNITVINDDNVIQFDRTLDKIVDSLMVDG